MEKLRKRIVDVKPQLAKFKTTYILARVLEKFPNEFNEDDFYNVWHGRSTSMAMTDYLEKFAARELHLEPA